MAAWSHHQPAGQLRPERIGYSLVRCPHASAVSTCLRAVRISRDVAVDPVNLGGHRTSRGSGRSGPAEPDLGAHRRSSSGTQTPAMDVALCRPARWSPCRSARISGAASTQSRCVRRDLVPSPGRLQRSEIPCGRHAGNDSAIMHLAYLRQWRSGWRIPPICSVA